MAVSRIVKILFLIYLVSSVLSSPLLFVCVGRQTRSPWLATENSPAVHWPSLFLSLSIFFAPKFLGVCIIIIIIIIPKALSASTITLERHLSKDQISW